MQMMLYEYQRGAGVVDKCYIANIQSIDSYRRLCRRSHQMLNLEAL